jgi:N-terminal domain of anti-restriction factor ArdC
MLIASQKPTATHVAGFHTWHKLGRFVKKGEKGILILAPIVRPKNQSVEQTETDESSTGGIKLPARPWRTDPRVMEFLRSL